MIGVKSALALLSEDESVIEDCPQALEACRTMNKRLMMLSLLLLLIVAGLVVHSVRGKKK